MPKGDTPTGEGRLGIIAGKGDLPVRLIRTCQDQGRDFLVIALKGQTEPDTVRDVPHIWVRLGSAASILPQLRAEGVTDLVMLGAVKRPSFLSLIPNVATAWLVIRTGLLARGDDGLLRSLARWLEGEGFRLLGAHELLPDLLAHEGPYGKCKPDDDGRVDIQVGILAAKALGARDVGQGVVVRGGAVIAEEDAQGTDAMLARLPQPTPDNPHPGGVLVKVAKPQQDHRLDLPTIGVGTVQGAVRAGLAGIAVEAGSALVVDADAVAREADAAQLFVIGVEAVP